jgi:hypothetical protein
MANSGRARETDSAPPNPHTVAERSTFAVSSPRSQERPHPCVSIPSASRRECKAQPSMADRSSRPRRSGSARISVSTLLVVLETLEPAERLAFVLHDVADGGTVKGMSRLVRGAPTSDADLRNQRRVVDAFLAAVRDGDFERLVAVRTSEPAAGGGDVYPPRLPRLLPGGALVGQAPRRGCCCLRRSQRGSRSGPTPASPSPSPRRSLPTSRWAMARRCGAERPPACSGGSRTSSDAACRPRRRAHDRAPPAIEIVGFRGGGDVGGLPLSFRTANQPGAASTCGGCTLR